MESHVTSSAASQSKQAPADTANWPLNTATPPATRNREKRQSLRVRPSVYLENAEPLSPLRSPSLQDEPLPRASSMSLFNLFSRPKVERQRGYTERQLDVPRPPPKDPRKNASTSNLAVHVQQANASSVQLPVSSPTVPALTTPTQSTSRIKFKEPPKPAARESKTGPFQPPPLFQAYPQATKEGTLEVSTLSVEAAAHRLKGRRSDATEEESGFDTRRRGTFRHGSSASSAHEELPRKIFVLVTSGYLLQYAETGPSNRLPERILHLSKDSVAFASDLLPGRHHVLQVSHAVDQNGMVATTGSFFSKLGLRSTAARRMTTSFLLVMPSPRAMEQWMTAIRREIETLGGKKIEHEPVRPSTREAVTAMTDLKRTPSHRYQVKRNPSKVDRLTSPSNASLTVPSPRTEPEGDDDSDTATIDGIEMEASKLDEDTPKEPSPRKRALSDVPSVSSSTAVSVEQAQLNNLRSSGSTSTRTSHTSHAGTVATPAAMSQPSSVTGSPPSDTPEKPLVEAERTETTAPSKLPYRPMASQIAGWRRSGVPPTMQKATNLPPLLHTSPAKPNVDTIEESPDAKDNPSVSTDGSPVKALTVARSEPNLKSATPAATKHDSKLVSLLLPHTSSVQSISPTAERPDPVVADIRSSTVQVPSRRTSLQPPARQTSSGAQSPALTERRSSKRISFSMPLKVNPSGVHAAQSSTPPSRRASQLYDPDAPGETPTVHTLSAKVDPTTRLSISQAQPIARSLTPEIPRSTPHAAPRARYSLVPEQHPLPTGAFPMMPTRASPSPTQAQMQAQAQANARTLRRPTSLQVRSDHAPFLSTVRNPQTGQIDARAIPIRGMKPSRSASNIATLATHPESVRDFKPSTPTLPEEADQATPLPERSVSPLPPRPGSRTGGRRGLRTRSALPELDLGIPVVGLGPPAPPPNAPLPLPPSGSRPTSPMPMQATDGDGIAAVAGLGIRVS